MQIPILVSLKHQDKDSVQKVNFFLFLDLNLE